MDRDYWRMPLDRLKRIARENIEYNRHFRDMARLAVEIVKAYISDGTVMRSRMRGNSEFPTAQGILKKNFVAFIDGVDVRCVKDLLDIVPQGTDRRIPAWVYGPVEACLEDDGWVLIPGSRNRQKAKE